WRKRPARSLNRAAILRSMGAQPRSEEIATRSLPRSAPVSVAGMPPISRGEKGARLSKARCARSKGGAAAVVAPVGAPAGKGVEVGAGGEAGRRAEPGDAAEGGRRPEAAAVVGAGGERHLAQRQRRRGAAGGAGTGLRRVERIARRAIDAVDGVGAGAELRRV